MQRFKIYLATQFLGGIADNTTCKSHTLLWFNDVANLEMWALTSIKPLFLDSNLKIILINKKSIKCSMQLLKYHLAY